MDITENEIYKNLKNLFKEYTDFSFKCISRLPYDAVKRWISFASGNVEDALEEKKSLWQLFKEFYAITILGCVASAIALWYLTAILAILLGGATIAGIAVGIMSNPIMTLGLLLAIILIALMFPLVKLLLYGLIMHALSKILGGKGNFDQTVSVIVLSSGASLTLMIPLYITYALIVGLFISPLSYAIFIYILYLQYKGIKHIHKLSTKRAAAVVVAPIVIILMIYAIFLIISNIIRLLYMFSG